MRVEFRFDLGEVVEFVIGTGDAIRGVVNTCRFTLPGVIHYRIHWLGLGKALHVADVVEDELRKIPSEQDDETNDARGVH